MKGSREPEHACWEVLKVRRTAAYVVVVVLQIAVDRRTVAVATTLWDPWHTSSDYCLLYTSDAADE